MSIDIRLYTVTLLVRSSPFFINIIRLTLYGGHCQQLIAIYFMFFYVLRHDVTHPIALLLLRGALKRCSHRGFRGSQRACKRVLRVVSSKNFKKNP